MYICMYRGEYTEIEFCSIETARRQLMGVRTFEVKLVINRKKWDPVSLWCLRIHCLRMTRPRRRL